jgi:glycosyltransferase involved in cell wall biosynthesis
MRFKKAAEQLENRDAEINGISGEERFGKLRARRPNPNTFGSLQPKAAAAAGWRKALVGFVGTVVAGFDAALRLLPHRYARRCSTFVHRILNGRFVTSEPQIRSQIRGYRVVPFPELPVAVSVLIPTRNAGVEFDRCLRAIREQQGLQSIELIVVDSSSTDGTQELARKHGAIVKVIPPESFDHGATRNDLAGLATHPFLFFTVQDAILLGHHALRDLAAFLLDMPGCAAVSARQVPRTDADLFASFSIWSHQLAMGWDRDQVRGPIDPLAFRDLPPAMRRRLAALDNVCCFIRRDAWQNIRFREPFEEDLDFGQRCLEAGWSLGYGHSIGVSHSHNRPAEYHLCRGVIDSCTVFRILNDPGADELKMARPNEVAAVGRFFLRILNDKLKTAPQRPLDLLLEDARELWVPDTFTPALRDADALGQEGDLAKMERLLATISGSSVSDQAFRILRESWSNLFSQKHLQDFCTAHRWASSDQSRAFLLKLVAGMIGVRLGISASFCGIPGEQLKVFTSGI